MRKKTIVGLDIGSGSVKMVELKKEGERITLVRAGQVSLGDPGDQRAKSRAIQLALKDIPLKRSFIVSVLSSPDTGFRKLRVPGMPISEIGRTLPWEMKEQLPFKMDDALFDFEILGGVTEEGVKKFDVLGGFSKRETVDDHLSLFKDLKRPDRLIPAPVALQGLVWRFQEDPRETTAILEMGKSVAELSVFRGGAVQFARKIPVAGQDFTRALMTPIRTERGGLALKAEEAERVKSAWGLEGGAEAAAEGPGIDASHIPGLVNPVADRLASEIERSLIFYQERSTGGRIERLDLFGSGASLKGLSDFLSRRLGIEVSLPDPFDRMVGKPKDPGFQKAPHVYALALGAALSGFEGMNLLPREIKEETQIMVRRATIKGVATAALLLFVFVYAGMRIELSNRWKEIEVARLEHSALVAASGKARRQQALQRLVDGEPYWEDVLRELSHILPEEAHLTKLVAQKGRIILEGLVVGEVESEVLLSKLVFRMEEGIFKNVSLLSTEKLRDGGSSLKLEAQLE